MQLPALAIQQPNVGNTLYQAAAIKNANTQGKLAEAGLAKEQALSGLRAGLMGAGGGASMDPSGFGTQESAAAGPQVNSDMMRRYLALDPKGGKQIIDGIAKMNEDQRAATKQQNETTTKLLLGVQSAPPEQRAVAWQNALRIAEQSGTDIKNAPQQYDPQWVQQKILLGMGVDDILKQQQGVEVSAGASLAKPDAQGKMQTTYTAPKDQSPTTAMKDAEAMGLKPGTPEYNNYIRERTMKAGVEVNTGAKMETELFKMDRDRVKEMREIVTPMNDVAPRLEMIAQLLESGNVKTGRFQQATLPLKQWAQSVGYVVDENLSEQEQVAAMMEYLVPRSRVVGSGASSDRDMQSFRTALPNFANTPQGNIILTRSMLQIHDRNKKAADLADSYLRKNKTLDGFDADKELGPLFPKPDSEDAYNDIKKGTVYIDTDGRFKVKK